MPTEKSNEKNKFHVSSSVEAAAHEAAIADGLIASDDAAEKSRVEEAMNKAKRAGLRRGKWTIEEEYYANRLIYEFKLGLLPLTDGTTLRTFLSKLLNCDPMRISKKFVGQNCIGKQVFRRRQMDLEKLTPDQIEQSRNELAELERKFLERVAQTNRTKTSSSTGSTGKGSVKDGRVDYEDEHGNQILAPWMIPPDQVQQQRPVNMQEGSGIGAGPNAPPGSGMMMGMPGYHGMPPNGMLQQPMQGAPGISSIEAMQRHQQMVQQQNYGGQNISHQQAPYGYMHPSTGAPVFMNDPRFQPPRDGSPSPPMEYQQQMYNASMMNSGNYNPGHQANNGYNPAAAAAAAAAYQNHYQYNMHHQYQNMQPQMYSQMQQQMANNGMMGMYGMNMGGDMYSQGKGDENENSAKESSSKVSGVNKVTSAEFLSSLATNLAQPELQPLNDTNSSKGLNDSGSSGMLNYSSSAFSFGDLGRAGDSMIWTNSFTNLDQSNMPASSNLVGNRSKASIAPNIPQGLSGLAGMMANSVGTGNMESGAGNSSYSYQQQQVSQQRHRSGSLDGDVGYPIDDADGNGDISSVNNNSGRSNGSAVDNSYSNKMNNPDSQLSNRMLQSENVGFHGTMIPPESMAAMASMYRPGSDHSSAAQQAVQAQHNRKLKHMSHQLEHQDSNTNNLKRESSKAGGKYSYNSDMRVVPNIPIISAPEVVPKAKKKSGGKETEANMPKNASVNDFWMLVNMGDLPQPEQDVLSHNMWGQNAPNSKNSNAASELSSQKPLEGGEGRAKEDATSNSHALVNKQPQLEQEKAALAVQTQQHLSAKRELSSSNGFVANSSNNSDSGGDNSNGIETNDDDVKSNAKSLPSSASSEHLSKKLKIEPTATQ